MISIRKPVLAALAAVPLTAGIAAAAPTGTVEADPACPLPVLNSSIAPDGSSAKIETTVSCTLGGVPLVSFPISTAASGAECRFSTVTVGQGAAPASIKLTAGFTCKPDASGKSSALTTVALTDPAGAERNSLRLANSNLDKQATLAKTTTVVEVSAGSTPALPGRTAGFAGETGSSQAQSDHEVQADL